MKIGVALSGCDIGGIAAHRVLSLLEGKGYELEMISACCMPAITALPHAARLGEKEMARLGKAFLRRLRQADLDLAVDEVALGIPPLKAQEGIPIAVNAANMPDGRITAFTNAFVLESDRLTTFPLEDAYDALSATVSPMDGLADYRYGGGRLCDYCIWHGCPLYPLKMRGIPRILSIAFLPEKPANPYEVLVRQMVASTAAGADLHIPIEFPRKVLKLEKYEKIATDKMESCMEQVYWKTLF